MARIALMFWAWGMGMHSSQLSAASLQHQGASDGKGRVHEWHELH
jgi:hypothetical protein